MPVKIAMIGAGSIGFTRRLMRDILAVPELADTIFAFIDISERNLDMVTQLCRRDIEANGVPAKIVVDAGSPRGHRRRDYVICMIRQGGLEAFQLDIDIPLKYGVDQCVGDTLCAGGIMYAQRTIPALLDFCKDIREVAKPDALFLNYSNPMAMNTWACNKYGGVQTIGLCHGVQGAHWQITDCIERWAKQRRADRPGRDSCTAARWTSSPPGSTTRPGSSRCEWRGMDMMPRLLELFEAHPEYPPDREGAHRRAAPLRLLQHRVERPPQRVRAVVSQAHRTRSCSGSTCRRWINGETGGYLRVCTEGRNWFETDFPQLAEGAAARSRHRQAQRGARLVHHRGAGDRADLPRAFQRRQPRPHHQPAGRLRGRDPRLRGPQRHQHAGGRRSAAGVRRDLLGHASRVQEMGVEAAVHGDVTLLKQAMLHDPLIGAVCNPEEVWQMTDEMLVAQAQWLPQYAARDPRGRGPPGRGRAQRQARAADRDPGRGPPAHQDGRRDGCRRGGRARQCRRGRQGKMTKS